MAAWQAGLLFFYITAIFFLLTTTPPAIANPLVFDYQGFKEGELKLEGDATVSDSSIDFIGKRGKPKNNNTYRVGRATSIQQMHLWDKTSRKLSNFQTEFSVLISLNGQENPFAEGLAFFMADPNLPFLQNVHEGGGLGLVDGNQILNSTKHSFLAVEFDSHHDHWDPNSTHVGININSMKSKSSRAARLIDSEVLVHYHCSIEYNATTHNIRVNSEINNNSLTKTHLSHDVDLSEYLPERVIVGFSVVTRNFSETHFLRSWSFGSSLDSQNPNHETKRIQYPNHAIATKRSIANWLRIGVGIAIAVGSLGLIFFALWKWKRKRIEANDEESGSDLNMDDEFQKNCGPKKFCHDELVRATNNFSEAKKLGHGGFGDVYKVFIKGLNSDVAIKRISKDSRQGIKEYASEVKIISQLRHRNLVQLIGWSHKKKDLLLIYEFMPNGSLDSHLYRGESFLTWEVRYNIALDLASALLYLHEEMEQCVLHRDIKSSNIMLDSSFNAKLGDFGLARLVDHKKGSKTTLIAGTRGYIAPEYLITGKASKETDVYSFGVVLLEIASGRKPIDLSTEDETTVVEWVWELYGLGKLLQVADPKLCGAFDEQQLERLAVVGIWCAHPDHSSRPSIMQVIQVLKFEAPLPSLPQKMPMPTYHPPTVDAVFC